MKYYNAPWGKTLIVTSAVTTVLCLGITACVMWLGVSGREPAGLRWVALLPTLILLGAAPFTVRGYAISSTEILVQRLFWSTSLPRSGLEAASYEPNAMKGSIRTFGNGGAFSFSGFYHSKRLGSYRAFVTNLRGTVVLRYPSRRIVLSPGAPEEFVNDLGLSFPSPKS